MRDGVRIDRFQSQQSKKLMMTLNKKTNSTPERARSSPESSRYDW
ncbi:hypothetical protein PROPEN_03604 [Proteus penneri ATCC 35198]|nr:hypothetical protein PROPEN_03604 [Proteus penneri ATCC 35198]